MCFPGEAPKLFQTTPFSIKRPGSAFIPHPPLKFLFFCVFAKATSDFSSYFPSSSLEFRCDRRVCARHSMVSSIVPFLALVYYYYLPNSYT